MLVQLFELKDSFIRRACNKHILTYLTPAAPPTAPTPREIILSQNNNGTMANDYKKILKSLVEMVESGGPMAQVMK
jgi:hypothetical protein